jgi:hypothetical protein
LTRRIAGPEIYRGAEFDAVIEGIYPSFGEFDHTAREAKIAVFLECQAGPWSWSSIFSLRE